MQAYPNERRNNFLEICKKRTFAKNTIDGIIEKITGIILNTFPYFMNFFLGKYFMEQSFHAVYLKTDSHIACRAHAAPMPFPCHAVPLRV